MKNIKTDLWKHHLFKENVNWNIEENNGKLIRTVSSFNLNETIS